MKKVLKRFFVALLITVLIVFIIVFVGGSRPDVLIFPVNRYIETHVRRWGTMVDLVPNIFSVGDTFENVDNKLIRAGYSKEPAKENKYIYTREANDLICNKGLYVFVEFDDSFKLKSAEGAVREHGCL